MSNDPKKQSGGRFRAAEMSDEEFERFYSEIYAEFGGQETKTAKAPKSTAAQSSQTAKKPQASRNTYADNVTPAKTSKKSKKKEKGVKGLVITACVECVGIVAVVLWWLLRIL